MNEFSAAMILILIGLFSTSLGMLLRAGYGPFRWIYITSDRSYTPIFSNQYILFFGGIPLGITALYYGLMLLLPAKSILGEIISKNSFLNAFIVVLPVFAIILAIWQPWWIKPAWLRWLEEEHGDILDLLKEEYEMNRSQVRRQIKTQAGLEKWVASVREKYGQPKPVQY